jgi:hypothetical protein
VLQAKLLRLLQDREFERLGSRKTQRIDVRFVLATHRDLDAMVENGSFRLDLFQRFNVVTLWIPPLRARRDDIELLAREFTRRFGAENGKRGMELAPEAIRLLRSQRWPEAQRICDLIREAFAGVMLGNGVGLRETRALDDYEDAAACAAIRAGDETEDWQRIPVEELTRYNGLAFFDAEGMRFHLPAFLIADLEDKYRMDMIFWLTHLSDHCLSQFELLSDVQRRAVREYLLFIFDDPDSCFDQEDIRRALDEYWVVRN